MCQKLNILLDGTLFFQYELVMRAITLKVVIS